MEELGKPGGIARVIAMFATYQLSVIKRLLKNL